MGCGWQTTAQSTSDWFEADCDTLWSRSSARCERVSGKPEGKYAQVEATFSQLLEIERRVNGPGSPGAASAKYNWACLEAREGNKDKALALLSDAVDHGLPPYFALGMGTNAGLTSLHSDPRFIAMVADVRKRATAAQNR